MATPFNLSSVIPPSSSAYTVPNTESTSTTTTQTGEQVVKRGRGRPRKNPVVEQVGSVELPASVPVSAPVNQQQNTQIEQYVPLCNSNDPYESSYQEGSNLIRQTIFQMDQLANEMKTEFNTVKDSKALKGRYMYMSKIGESIGTILNGKLSAIKELNGITTKCHELEMKRFQQNKELQKAADDDRYIADMYNAYINTPVNTGSNNPFLQMTSQNTIANPGQMMGGVQVMANGDITNGYDNFMHSISPEQNRMILENNPNIETVVVLDQSTGERHFDVIDTSTGYSVPNYPTPSPELLDETNLDTINGIASNSNIGQSWKIVVQGNPLENF